MIPVVSAERMGSGDVVAVLPRVHQDHPDTWIEASVPIVAVLSPVTDASAFAPPPPPSSVMFTISAFAWRRVARSCPDGQRRCIRCDLG
jgi:hypothetical protein